MVDYPRERPNLNYIGDGAGFDWMVEKGAAVMSWKDDGYLRHMHRVVDLDAGNVVVVHDSDVTEYDEEEDCCLVSEEGSCLFWIPKAYAETPMGGSTREALENSESLKWMTKGTVFDNNMLAIMEIEDNSISGNHMSGFYERVIKLLVEVEKWI